VTSEVTHIDPPRTWGVRGIDGPIRAAVDVTVDPLDGEERSRVTIAIDFTGHEIGKLLVPLVVRPQARNEMPTNLQRLKERLEGGCCVSGCRGDYDHRRGCSGPAVVVHSVRFMFPMCGSGTRRPRRCAKASSLITLDSQPPSRPPRPGAPAYDGFLGVVVWAA
jgi:hypothetical protein